MIKQKCEKLSKLGISWLKAIKGSNVHGTFAIFQADEINCHIITVPGDILKKFKYLGKDQLQFSQETVKDFYEDAISAGYKI